jgi:hypothetical protein
MARLRRFPFHDSRRFAVPSRERKRKELLSRCLSHECEPLSPEKRPAALSRLSDERCTLPSRSSRDSRTICNPCFFPPGEGEGEPEPVANFAARFRGLSLTARLCASANADSAAAAAARAASAAGYTLGIGENGDAAGDRDGPRVDQGLRVSETPPPRRGATVSGGSRTDSDANAEFRDDQPGTEKDRPLDLGELKIGDSTENKLLLNDRDSASRRARLFAARALDSASAVSIA